MRSKVSIQQKLFAGLLAGFALFAIALLILLGILLENGLTSYFGKEFAQNGTIVTKQITEMHEELASISDWFDKSPEITRIVGEKNRTAASQTAKNIADSFKLDAVIFFDDQGKNLQDDSDISQYTLVHDALVGKSGTDLIADGKIIAVYSISPIHVGGKIAGGVIVQQTLSKEAMLQNWKELLNSDITLFSGDTRIITTLDSAGGTSITGTKIDNKVIEETVLKQGKSYQGFNTVRGVRYLTSYVPITLGNGSICGMIFVGRSLSSIKNVSSDIYRIVAPGTILFLVLLLLIYVILIRIVVIKPLTHVVRAVHNLASGRAELSWRIDISSDDELGMISKDINSFMEILQTLIKDMKITQETLLEIGERLGSNAHESASAITQITSNIEGMQNQSAKQSESVSRTETILSGSITNVNGLNSSIESQAAGITESSAAIEEMVGNIGAVTTSVEKMGTKFRDLVSTTEQGRSQLTEVDSRVKKIAEQSALLLEANAIIAQIASQTNLLAMNAAIEAAHAGSAGAGFSVVADEIRKLAETSSKQSKTINTELKAITTSINEVVQSSRSSQTAFGVIVGRIEETDTLVREISQAMIEQKSASQQILEALRDMNNESADVQEKSRQLLEGLNSVSGEMSAVSEISKTIHGNMDEMTQGTREINDAAREVSNLATKTHETILHMEALLEKFIV